MSEPTATSESQLHFRDGQIAMVVHALSQLDMEMMSAANAELVTGLKRMLAAEGPDGGAPDSDAGYRAQQAAETHLAACDDAMYAEEGVESIEDLPESPAVGPYCGCQTCLVREVLYAAWPIIEADARQQASPEA